MDHRISESLWLGGANENAAETTIGTALRDAALKYPDRLALVSIDRDGFPARRLTYSELLEQAERAARGLLARCSPGERVAIWAENSPEWIVLEFGAALAGIVLVTVNPALGFDELRYVLNRVDAAGLFYGTQSGAARIVEQLTVACPQLRERVALAALTEFSASGRSSERLPVVASDHPAQIQHTSGTTGLPKAVLLAHGSIMARARIGAALAKVTPDDRMINPMPMFHTSGCNWMALGSVLSGAVHVLLRRFDARSAMAIIEAERGTTLVGFATMLQRMVEHAASASYDLGSIRYVVSGGTSVPTPLARRIERCFGSRLSVLYGMTECSGVITQTSVDDPVERVGTSVGRPFPETDLKVIDPATGLILPVGEIGELCVRGRLVMQGYLGATSPIDAQGWLHTGDFGSIDADGYCSVEGRRYDLILRNGRYLSPRPLEERLAGHPAVAEVVVIPLADDRGGRFVATIRPLPGLQPDVDELRAYVSSVPGELPTHWRFVEVLPLTGTGKVHRYRVHEQLESTYGRREEDT